MSKDEFIKNPNRKYSGLQQSNKYTPEYLRLGREPIVLKPEKNLAKDLKGLKKAPGTKSASDTIPYVGQQNWYDIHLNKIEDEEKAGTEEIFAEDVPDVPDVPDDLQETSEEKTILNQSSNLEDLSPGEYCLVVKGSVIASSDSKEGLEAILESLIFDNESEFDVNEIILLKRLPLKIGVLVLE